ncbi:dephospho-CoA kinase [Paenibacillus sp. TRM 82003]|nr:dephospho-CoA kinase [Paenibacillus sp. TRM 82003]
MNVGLTGGIACGKSTVSKMFKARGAHIVDADRIARDVVMPGQPALSLVAEAFGDAVIAADGSLDRSRLGSIVFGDAEARKRLESILHPRIREEMARQMDHWAQEAPETLTIVDIPLLFESGLDKLYDFKDILVVYAPREVQLERLMSRDGLSLEDATKRLAAQMPIEEKRALADVVIDNGGSLQDTEKQVEGYIASLRERS